SEFGRSRYHSALTTAATAPFCTAVSRNRCPSVWSPLRATNRVPGVTARLSSARRWMRREPASSGIASRSGAASRPAARRGASRPASGAGGTSGSNGKERGAPTALLEREHGLRRQRAAGRGRLGGHGPAPHQPRLDAEGGEPGDGAAGREAAEVGHGRPGGRAGGPGRGGPCGHAGGSGDESDGVADVGAVAGGGVL